MSNSPAETDIFRGRLLNVARACREDPDPKKFSMCFFGRCGTPGCALGHYAARSDLQNVFILRRTSNWLGRRGKPRHHDIGVDSPLVHSHFGLRHTEAEELFGASGCGNAKTPIQAAEYIERFVATKYPVSIDG